MHDLLMAADDAAAQSGFDWSALAVPVIAGTATLAVAFWNTRGETVAIRRLKGMNEVIEKMPADDGTTKTLTAARNVLATRLAARITGPSWWKRVLLVAAGVVVGVLVVLGLTWAASLFPEASDTAVTWIGTSSIVLGALTAAFVATQMLTSRQGRAAAQREVDFYLETVAQLSEEAKNARDAAKAAHPSSGQ